MYSVGILQNRIYNAPAVIPTVKRKELPAQNVFAQNPINKPSFTAEQPQTKPTKPVLTLRTELTTKEEKDKYSALVGGLDKKGRKNLDKLLKTGILLNTKSNDKTSTLDNLYRILTEPRAQGLDPNVVLRETVTTLANPFVITQRFGDIPAQYLPKALQTGHTNAIPVPQTQTPQPQPQTGNQAQSNDGINEQSINVEHSGDCVAASIEFNLAKQMPAEFARFAADLSSPKGYVEKTIQTKNLANNSLDAVWLLNAFEVPYEMKNFDSAKLKLAPDKNALIRAQIQNSNKDNLERSLVDVLMQSTFMNVGSQQTYNSLTDIRGGKFNQDNKGLIEFEKTFTESIVEDKNKISVTYQVLDENAKLTGYETDFKTIKKHILDSLAIGENVIIGYTQLDNTNTVINGHEITIIGVKQASNGKLIFICNDTDDNNPNPIEYPEDYIIPKIHHAGLPQEVVEKDVKFVDNWVEGVNAYKEAKKQPKTEHSGEPSAQAA